MIRINLLPEEMRRTEGTPLPRRLAIFGGALLIAMLAMAWITVHLQTLPMREEAIVERTRERDDLQKKVDAEVIPLEQYLAATKNRQKIAEDARASLVRWAPLLDAVWTSVVSREGTWLEDLGLVTGDVDVVSEKNPRKKTKVPEQVLRLQCVTTLLGSERADIDRAAKIRIAEAYDRLVADVGPVRQNDLAYYDFGIGTWEVTPDYEVAVGGVSLRFELFLRVRSRKAYDDALVMP